MAKDNETNETYVQIDAKGHVNVCPYGWRTHSILTEKIEGVWTIKAVVPAVTCN